MVTQHGRRPGQPPQRLLVGGRSVQTPSNTSATMPIDSHKVGCGWIVLPTSTGSQPISTARCGSPMRSLACVPMMPPSPYQKWSSGSPTLGWHDLPSQRSRVARDHQFLVRGNHPHRDRLDAVLRRGPPAVFAWVSRSTPARQPACTPLRAPPPRAHRCRRKHHRIQPAERGGERAELAPDAIHEQIDGELRPRSGSRGAYACRSLRRTPQGARLLVEKGLDRAAVHLSFLHQVEVTPDRECQTAFPSAGRRPR